MGSGMDGGSDGSYALANGLMVVNNLVIAVNGRIGTISAPGVTVPDVDYWRFAAGQIQGFIANAQILRVVGGGLQFPHTVAPGGGGINIYGPTGITSVTDAGGVGLIPLNYNPTSERIALGTLPALADISFWANTLQMRGDTSADFAATNVTISQMFYTNSGLFSIWKSTIIEGANGWLLAKGVNFDDDFEGIIVDPSKWRQVPGAGGAITMLTPARGGICSVSSIAAAAPSSLDNANILTISRQDAYRIYSRWRAVENVTTIKAVGLSDLVAAATWYTANGIASVMDTSLAGALATNWVFQGITATVVVSVDSTVAHDTNAHTFELIPSGTSYTLYIGGTLVATLTTLQYPAAATMMQRFVYSRPTGAAILSDLRIDCYKMGMSRNTGTGDT